MYGTGTSRAVKPALYRPRPVGHSPPEDVEPLVYGLNFGRWDVVSVGRVDQEVGQAAHAPESRQQVLDAMSITGCDPLCVLLDPNCPALLSVPSKELSQVSCGPDEWIG